MCVCVLLTLCVSSRVLVCKRDVFVSVLCAYTYMHAIVKLIMTNIENVNRKAELG